ncbi:lysylphosphatidylglycerol synthase transmembrane domain-containing protein [Alloyangia pacifica]|uniref:lysylphosphatidylglycerol synthase transmembrane domain-containing protein n=1 Tax=Alloyangia pacifica TaxID=311180 RepID=UPI001CFE7D77|nr:lysylphosphatidylglycerol synthase transmembrane domain-containing protein [Alloyangia pacifica]
MRVLRLAIPLALIALCLALADGRAALQRLAALSPGWLLVTLALLNAVTLLSALRWRLTAAALELPLRRGAAVREYYVAQLVNQTLPGGVLGDAARAVRSRQGGPMRPAAQAVVLERAAGQAAMLVIALTGLALLLIGPGPGLRWGASPAASWQVIAVLTALALGVGLLLARRRGRPGGWRTAIRRAIVQQLPAQASLSLAIAVLTVAAFATAARAGGSALPAGLAALIVPLILTAMLLPASVAGWGWREGAAAALFPLAGLSAEAGLTASIAFGVTSLLAALPGAFFLRAAPHRKAPAPAGIASSRD